MARVDQQLNLLARDAATARPDRRLKGCALAVVALHGLVLAWMSLRPDNNGTMSSAVSGRPVQVRMLSMAPMPSPGQQGEAQAEAPVLAQAAATQASPAIEKAPESTEAPIDLTGYVPRRWLTVAPRPTAPVVLPFPATFNDAARYTVVLNLYIEADGRVGRIEFEGVPLPELLERAARITFENAHFTPGQVNGRIVKSLIRVEVDFDNLGQG